MITQINRKILYKFCTQLSRRTHRPPKLLSGELQHFKFDFQTAKLYDGYNLDELYGSKIGVKHPLVVRAQMTKDTIASIILFGVCFGIILHMDWLFRKQYEEIKSVNNYRLNRTIKMRQQLTNLLEKK